ncbi:cytochrome P450 [Earliella scabrosa]|nr:cytochrome P450 [Earliella scabrosa]
MSLIAYATSAAVAYLVWRLLRIVVLPSALDNIPGPPSSSIWAGNMLQFLRQNHWDFVQHLRETYGPIAKINGLLGDKWLHVHDIKALHSMLVKDQEHYWRGPEASSLVELTLGPGLLSAHGSRHKKQRKMLNPVFSTAHMRNMTPLFYAVTRKLRIALESRVKDGPKELDVLAWMGRTALELIGQGGLGHSFDPLLADSQDDFAQAVKELIPSLSYLQPYRNMLPYLKYLGPSWFRTRLLDIFPDRNLRHVRHIVQVIYAGSKEVLRSKRAALERGDQELLHTVGEGKDIMSILLKENMSADEEDKLPDEELLAQMSTFIFAGVDTTSNAMSRVIHLLSEHTDVQNKLREEIIDARERYGGDIPYDELSQLPYLDAICRETLRLHAPVNIVSRKARTDTVLPLSTPIRGVDGKQITEIPIPRDTTIFANLRQCNTDPELWGEDADEWKPERWLQPLPHAVEEARVPGIYANLMTFGSGSRSCIGFKFSQLEMKVVLSALVASFKFEPSDKPIVWRFAGITYPAASKDSAKPEMFLKVSLA